jgi:hypothetical protein
MVQTSSRSDVSAAAVHVPMSSHPPSPKRRKRTANLSVAAERSGEASRGDAEEAADDAAAAEADLWADAWAPEGLEDMDAWVPYAQMSVAAQEAARTLLQERLGAYLTTGRPRVLVTDNVHTMVSIKRGDGVVTFRLHHMFLEAPAVVLRALGRYAERQDRDSARMLREFIDSNERRVRKRESARPISVDVEGKYHNLQELFDGLNEAYFGGSIKARITWGPRTKRKASRESIKLGSYTFEDELIRIHPVLDAADVPSFFVEWIVYHEMLHEIHDMPVVDGRRIYHTAEFRRAEAEFERYAEAVLWERTQLHKLLER